jgi:photosystem II stability/assembly factor-like uncharacterized protein
VGLFLLNSFVLKEKVAGTKPSKATKGAAKETPKESPLVNVVFQSIDGGQTWKDISKGLPGIDDHVNFFAGESDIYLTVKNAVYRSKGNLKSPVWEKENIPGPKGSSITFNHSGVMAVNHIGQIYKKTSGEETWFPIHTDFKRTCTHAIFETSDGTVLLGVNNDIYRSTDKGKNWKQVQSNGLLTNIVESEGVLIATGKNGIMRSTDYGENWQSAVNEGGVGIAAERIEGGFAAIAYNTETQSRRIHISLDNGKNWQAIDKGLPASPSISSIKQMGKYLIVGHPDGVFRSSDMGKTWDSVLPSVDKVEKTEFKLERTWGSGSGRVFKIFDSGKKLYAVAVNSGC